jgi:hypothetical protein
MRVFVRIWEESIAQSRKGAKEMRMDVSWAVWAEFPIRLGERPPCRSDLPQPDEEAKNIKP